MFELGLDYRPALQKKKEEKKKETVNDVNALIYLRQVITGP